MCAYVCDRASGVLPPEQKITFITLVLIRYLIAPATAREVDSFRNFDRNKKDLDLYSIKAENTLLILWKSCKNYQPKAKIVVVLCSLINLKYEINDTGWPPGNGVAVRNWTNARILDLAP